MNLFDLINEAESIELISSKSKDLSSVVRNYRNLIHPGREIRTKEDFDYETAIVSFSLVKIILKEIKENYVKKYGYRAEDIFNKITVDSSTYSIYNKLILKLNEHEQMRLASLLVEYQIENYSHLQSANYGYYIRPLKSLIGDDNLISFCNYLIKEVEKGEEQNILALFEIFGDNLDLMSDEDKDLILTYIYTIVDNVHPYYKKLESKRFRELYSFLGLYVDSPKYYKKLLYLLREIVTNYSKSGERKWCYLSVYQNLVGSFSLEKKAKCEEHIRTGVTQAMADEFYSELVAYTELPF